MSTELTEALMVELAYCRQAELPVSETAQRIAALVTRKHVFWGAGESDCPREIKASNGELHTLRCKVCGEDSPRLDMPCRGALARRIAAEREAVVVGITGEMPGSNGGFSMAVFKADDVPIGTKLYAHPPKEPNT